MIPIPDCEVSVNDVIICLYLIFISSAQDTLCARHQQTPEPENNLNTDMKLFSFNLNPSVSIRSILFELFYFMYAPGSMFCQDTLAKEILNLSEIFLIKHRFDDENWCELGFWSCSTFWVSLNMLVLKYNLCNKICITYSPKQLTKKIINILLSTAISNVTLLCFSFLRCMVFKFTTIIYSLPISSQQVQVMWFILIINSRCLNK